MPLRPTHQCYNDALELICEWIRLEPDLPYENPPTVWLVHGICTDSEKGFPYAHAWVERDGMTYTGALDENGIRVYVEVPREQYIKIFGVTEANAYSIKRAWEENKKHGHYGPWTPEHIALTAKGLRERGLIK